MDRLERLSALSDTDLTDAIVNHAMIASRGDVVIITSRPGWTHAQIIKYMEQLHEITLALGLQFSFMIVHGEVEIEHARATGSGDNQTQA